MFLDILTIMMTVSQFSAEPSTIPAVPVGLWPIWVKRPDEEIDFIINSDIKYRIGKELERERR
jgi:hypothetical protein